MKIKFEKKLDYQLDAINSVVNIFKKQKLRQEDIFMVPEDGVIQNRLDLDQEYILMNIKEIQKENGIGLSDKLDGMNFTIEMETGTGKTYVYLRTIFELNANYGFQKFIIIVPS